MEVEDHDSEEAEKPIVINFDPSLPTTHSVCIKVQNVRTAD